MSNLRKVLAMAVCLLWGMLSAGLSFAQDKTITGVVTDETGEPLIGAGVTVDGDTSTGQITDLDGKYSITVPASTVALRFSYIGMEDAVETIGDRTVINVALKSANMALEATVVTAMGIKKSEKSLSYNVQEMKLDNISPTGSFVNALNGKVAGVNINTSSAGIGGGSRVVMRGTKSLSNNNNALYVIDGIPMSSPGMDQPSGLFAGAGQTGDVLGQLNPDDIASISVLSGPSAAALYGSSAANGVVVITTKKGQAGTTSVNYSNTTEFSRAYIMPKFQNTYGPTEENSYQSWGAKMDSPSSYSPRDFFQTGFNETNAINFSTGNDKNQFYASFAATNAEGIIRNNQLGKYNLAVRNSTKLLNDKLTLDISLNYSNVLEQNMISQGQYHNPVVPVYLFPAGADFDRIKIYERYNAERNFKTQYWPYNNDLSMQNPYWITERERFQNRKNRLFGTVQLKYDITKWLNVSVRGKFDYDNELREKKLDASTLTLFASKYGYYSNETVTSVQKFGEVLLNANKYFGDNIVSLTATVGGNVDYSRVKDSFVGGNLSTVANMFTYNNIDRTHSGTELKQTGYEREKQALFANVQVGYKSKVYLDVTGRFDWASTFAKSDNNPFFYYSAGLSGIITEIFPQIKSSVFPYWKLRASYSEVGNEPDVFLTIPTYSLNDGKLVTKTRMPYTDLNPELTKSWELGTNIHFLDSKLQIDATLYKSSTYNQFFNFTLSAASQYTSITANAGQVDNKGIEVSARYGDDWGGFHWDTYATYTRNLNKVAKLVDSFHLVTSTMDEYYSINKLEPSGKGGVKTIIYPGGSMGDLYVTSLKTDERGYLQQTSTGNVIADYSDAGYLYAGDTNPDHIVSWGNNFSFKGFNLGFQFNGRFGGIVVSKTQQLMDYYGISKATADARDRGYVMINGMKSANVKEFYQTIGSGDGVLSQYVYDATNIRLGELSFGYDFPVQNWCKWCKGLNLTFVAHNLWMLYLKAPFDPEMTSSTSTYDQGIDYFMQPSTRSFGFSLKVRL